MYGICIAKKTEQQCSVYNFLIKGHVSSFTDGLYSSLLTVFQRMRVEFIEMELMISKVPGFRTDMETGWGHSWTVSGFQKIGSVIIERYFQSRSFRGRILQDQRWRYKDDQCFSSCIIYSPHTGFSSIFVYNVSISRVAQQPVGSKYCDSKRETPELKRGRAEYCLLYFFHLYLPVFTAIRRRYCPVCHYLLSMKEAFPASMCIKQVTQSGISSL